MKYFVHVIEEKNYDQYWSVLFSVWESSINSAECYSVLRIEDLCVFLNIHTIKVEFTCKDVSEYF